MLSRHHLLRIHLAQRLYQNISPSHHKIHFRAPKTCPKRMCCSRIRQVRPAVFLRLSLPSSRSRETGWGTARYSLREARRNEGRNVNSPRIRDLAANARIPANPATKVLNGVGRRPSVRTVDAMMLNEPVSALPKLYAGHALHGSTHALHCSELFLQGLAPNVLVPFGLPSCAMCSLQDNDGPALKRWDAVHASFSVL